MSNIEITDKDLASLKGKVVLVTGGSSGIGLATAKLLLSLGAKIMVGDVNKCPLPDDGNLIYQHVDVRDWESQKSLFKKAIDTFGRIEHVFANAGIGSSTTYVEDDDDLSSPPNNATLDINLKGVIYTSKLGIHYLKKQATKGSIVITASAAALVPFRLTDYCVAKHAVHGLTRGLAANFATTSVRVNCLAPLWTSSGLVPAEEFNKLGVTTQGADVVAKAAALCMVDESRNGQCVVCVRGIYKEIEQSLLETTIEGAGVQPEDNPADEKGWERMLELLKDVGSA